MDDDSLGSLLEDIARHQRQGAEQYVDAQSRSQQGNDGEPSLDGEGDNAVFAMLQRQLQTVTKIRSDLSKRELLVETLRQHCAQLEKEALVIPELQKRSIVLDTAQQDLVRLSAEFEALTATVACEQAERRRLEQELSHFKQQARELQEQGKQDRERARQELATLGTQLAAEQEKALLTQGLCESLQMDLQLNEAGMLKEVRARKSLEASAAQLQTELGNCSAALEKQKQRDVLSAGVASLKLEASQWKGLYEDLEGSVRAFRLSADGSQQRLLLEMSSLKEAVAAAVAAQQLAERERDITSHVIESLGLCIDTIVNASPRAQSSPSQSSPSSSSSPFTPPDSSTVQHIANFRVDMRAAIRQLGRLDSSALSPAIHHAFHKLVGFLNDVIVDSLNVQEEVHVLRLKLDTAAAAVESATELLGSLEDSLRRERETVERREKEGRRMVAYVRSTWRQLRESLGVEAAEGETESENDHQASEDAQFDNILPPLHNIFSLVTRKAHLADTLAERHGQSQLHIDSLLRSAESSRAHWEQQQHEQEEQLQEKVRLVQIECARAIEAAKRESSLRDEVWQEQLAEEKAAVAAAYREELEAIKSSMQESFDQKIHEIIIETAGREVGRDRDEQRVEVYKAVCCRLCKDLAREREEKQLWGGKVGGLYGSVMRRLLKYTLPDCELVAALGAACDTHPQDHERVIFRSAAYAAALGKRRRSISLRTVTIYLLAALRFRALLMALRRGRGGWLGLQFAAFDVLEGGSADQVADAMLAAMRTRERPASTRPSLLQRINLCSRINAAPDSGRDRLKGTIMGLQSQLDTLQAERDFLAGLVSSLQKSDKERDSLFTMAQQKVAAYGQTVDLIARESNERTHSVLRVALAHTKGHAITSAKKTDPVSPASNNGASGYLTTPPVPQRSPDPSHPVVKTLLQSSGGGIHPSILREDLLQLYCDVGRVDEYKSLQGSYRRSGLELPVRYPVDTPKAPQEKVGRKEGKA